MTTLDCTDIKALLSAFVDDEIDPANRHQVERHLTGCATCRDLVSEAEQLNQMITLDVQGKMWPTGLPAGFESAVLGQTVHAGRGFTSNRQRLTNWMGWVAAAACLSLATSIWFLDRQGAVQLAAHSSDEGNAGPHVPGAAPLSTSLARNRSWTYTGSLPADGIALASMDRALSSDEIRHIDSQIESVLPVANRASDAAGQGLDQLSLSPAMSQEDAQTLAAAGDLLDMLARADLSTFADAERIRQIAEYDELLVRLADTRSRLATADRPVVIAAESVLLRLVRGPVSLEDLREMHETVAKMNLSGEVNAISNHYASAQSI